MNELFHYCNSATFASIVSKKTIWLSSLSLSNDSMEGRLVSQTFDRLLNQTVIGQGEMEEIRQAISFAENMFYGLGFCLSEIPDLLSQWRGYADDGRGFAIGFSVSYLEQLKKLTSDEQLFRIEKVLYEPKQHEEAIRPIYDEIKIIVDSGKLELPTSGLLSSLGDENVMSAQRQERLEAIKALWRKVVHLHPNVFKLKNKAFAEEAEWRLIADLLVESNDLASYRALRDRIIPYREIALRDIGLPVISSVYIGPKNITPDHVVGDFLASSGYLNVKVNRSSATYR